MELYNKEFVYFDWDDKLEGKKGFSSDDINTLKQAVKDNRTGLYGEIIKNTGPDSQFPFETIDNSGWHGHFRFCYYDPYYEFRRAYLEGKQLQFRNSEGDWEDVHGEPLFNKDQYRIKPDDIIWKVVLSDDGSLAIAKSTDKHVYFTGNVEECNTWIKNHSKFVDIMWAWEREHKSIQYNHDDGKGWLDCKDWDNTPCEPNWELHTEYRIKEEYVPFDSVQELIDGWKKKSGLEFNRELLMPLIWIKRKEKNQVYLITEFLFENDCCNCNVGTSYENLELKELFENFTFLDGSIIGKVKE